MNKIAACVLIRREGYGYPDKFLAVGRRDNPEAFGLPGGKIEEGETALEAAKRELVEETGYFIREPQEVFQAVDEEGWHTTTFLSKLSLNGQQPTENLNVKWVTKQQLLDGPFGEYNRKLFAKLRF